MGKIETVGGHYSHVLIWRAFRAARIAVPRFLVTSGFRRLQESKVQALGIGKLLTGIYVDAIDEPRPRGKQRIE